MTRTLLLILCMIAGAVLLTCRGPARQTYPVTAAQLAQMAQIAGIPPCPQGPAALVGLKARTGGGGVLVVQCTQRTK